MKRAKFFVLSVIFFSALIISNLPAYADLATEQIFVRALQGIADYSMPGVGVDKKSYLPYDHIRIDENSSLTYGRGTYSAAAKVAAYIVFLLKCYEQEGCYAQITLSPTLEEAEYLNRNYSVEATNKTIALLRLKRMFKTVKDCLSRDEETGKAPFLSGMLAWLSINRDGNVTRDKDLVPLLDNGLLSWSYAALLGGLNEEDSVLAGEVYGQAKELLERQNYQQFIDHNRKYFHGEIDVVTGLGNPDYMLQRVWTEDVLSILWGLFTTSMPEEEKIAIWNNSLCPIIEWEMRDGEKIDAPKGYVASNHEIIWTLIYVPLSETALNDLFNNSQYLQADFAIKTGSPGFQAVAYNPIGSYMKMGIPDVSEFPEYVQQFDNAITFATAAGVLIDRERGGRWLSSLMHEHGLITKYGPLESVGLPGRADILSADSQYLVASAIGGGVRKDVERYLKKTKVKGSDENCYDFMKRLFAMTHKRILKDNSISSIRSYSKPFPLPERILYEHEKYRLPPQVAEFEILDHLTESNDDRHGANTHSPGNKNRRWEIDKDGILVGYTIAPELDKYYRFAWWGTYLGKKRPYLAAYTDISVTVPNDDSEQKIMMHLKREDCSLVKPVSINTRLPGKVSEDGRWKTYTFPLKHRKRFIRFPLTYIAFSIDDPEKNQAFNYTGSIRIKSLKLFNRYIEEGQIDVNKSIAELQKAPFVSCRTRPNPVRGNHLRFLDSGAVGEATEDMSREEEELLYFEFEDVNTNCGFSGIWTLFSDVELNDAAYFVFDITKGEMEQNPSFLRLEFKRQEPDKERIIFYCNLDLRQGVFFKNRWCRIVIPLPQNLRKEKINMINFVYDNRTDKIPSGSILISSPAFVENMAG